MANRYWVGGSGTWNTSSTTNWSDTSGGAGGFSVPTAADNVFFDQAGTYTVTCTGALTCLDFTVSAGTVTFAQGTAPTFAISGSMSLVAATVWTATGIITFNAATTGKTIITNGATLGGAVTFNGTGAWTLGSAFTTTGVLTLTAGSFTTANYAVSCTTLSSNNVNTRSLTLGSSTISLTINLTLTTITGLTFDAGTSQINCSNTSVIFGGGGLTFYNVAFTSTTAGTRVVTGANTFNNFAVTGPSTAGVTSVTFSANQTINGTLSTNGTVGNERVWFRSATYGLSFDLVVNAAPSLTDADFRGLYVTGTASPISGTRLGNRGECRGITFDTPKTVYWNLAAGGNWSSTAWATSSGGVVSNDNFPLPQDTAIIENTGLNNGATITLDTNIGYIGTIDMSTRTTAMTLTVNAQTVYGSWKNGSGVTITGAGTLAFQGGNTQLITSAGKSFSGNFEINTYGGTVKLADAFSTTVQWSVFNGTFDTDGNPFTIYSLDLAPAGFGNRAVYFRNSTVTLTSISGGPDALLTFDAGTSTINATVGLYAALTYYDVNLTAALGLGYTGALYGSFRNLTVTTDGFAGVFTAPSTGITVTGTLSMASANALSRFYLQSATVGTQITVSAATVSTLSDVDFMDVAFASPVSGTRLGDAGGNSNITFPSPKTVYWNLAGAQSWYAAGWATSSGGAPAANNFPLPQDTAVFDNTGSVTGAITIPPYGLIGTLDASARTTAMTLAISATWFAYIFGDLKLGTGVTTSQGSSYIYFQGRGTQTITSNGRTIVWGVYISKAAFTGPPTTQLADAIVVTSTIGITNSGGFNAVTYNVTTPNFTTSSTLNMGTGTWTLTSTGTVWSANSTSVITKGTANIVLSSTSTVSRTFAGNGFAYNRLTIGGTTGTGSILTITGSNSFTELASTKTVAHTIALGTTSQTFGAWSVTGTVGNVVTVTGTSTTHVIAGPRVSGVNYLAMGTIGFTNSPGEFYAGVNSTGTGAGVILTAAPAARTLYWVGGTGNWSSTTKWSTSSGGASGAAIPTSADAVVFDSASNATAYTATIDAGVTIARCASFTMAGPASGNVTFAGTVGIAFQGNVTFAATGITRTYTGAMQLSGNGSYTFTTNGLVFASSLTQNGMGSTWTLGVGGLDLGSSRLFVNYGSFSTSASNYSITAGGLTLDTVSGTRSLSLNGSTVTCSGLASNTTLAFSNSTNLTFSAGTSQINLTAAQAGISSAGLTFYNVAFTSTAGASAAITGANTFNTLSFAGQTTLGINPVTFSASQTIGTLTLNAGTAAAYRTFLASNTIGTQRTLAVTTLTAGAADVDFRDIAVTGTAAPLTGTRFGDCKGNSGITFDAAKTVYYRQTGTNTWASASPGSWSLTSGGAFDATAFPLAQDTAVFPSATYPVSGSTVTISASYNIGTIDMSARTSNTMTLATSSATPTIYGNWLNGTGTTLSGSGVLTFSGRGTQNITSAGKPFSYQVRFNNLTGSVVLQDAFVANVSSSGALQNTSGTFNLNGYTVTVSGSTSTFTVSAGTLAFGTNGTVILGGTGGFSASAGVTVTGTGTISLTSGSAKTFAGGGNNYSGITVDQGGAGALTITGNNTFKDITNTYSATGASTISLGSTITTLMQFTGTGAATRLLTLSGTSAASPATLILSSGTVTTPDYLSISNVRAYSLTDTWYAGANSTNLGSLGWIFTSGGGVVYFGLISESTTATDAVLSVLSIPASIADTAAATDVLSATLNLSGAVSELVTGTDVVLGGLYISSAFADATTITDAVLGVLSMSASISDTATATDAVLGLNTMYSVISETGTATDAVAARMDFVSAVSDLATATDATTLIGTFNVAALETATGTDALTVIGTYNVATTNLATVTDATNGAFLWNPIDDSQLPNWQNINDAQTPGWGSIDDSQNPDWTPVIP